MVRRSRLGRSAALPVSHHQRLAKCRAVLGRAFGPEAIAKASAGSGLVFLAGAPVAAAANPLIGSCFVYLGLVGPTGFGLTSLAQMRARRERAKHEKRDVTREIKEYLHEQEIRAAKARRTQAKKQA